MTYFRLFLIGIFFIFCDNTAIAQVTTGYYHSNLRSMVSVGYKINNMIEPSLRIGLDNYIEDIHIEPVVTFRYNDSWDYSPYVGVGTWLSLDELSLVFPIGFDVAPFTNKQFGFHFEMTPIVGFDLEYLILRGSIGFRYYLKKKD